MKSETAVPTSSQRAADQAVFPDRRNHVPGWQSARVWQDEGNVVGMCLPHKCSVHKQSLLKQLYTQYVNVHLHL